MEILLLQSLKVDKDKKINESRVRQRVSKLMLEKGRFECEKLCQSKTRKTWRKVRW